MVVVCDEVSKFLSINRNLVHGGYDLDLNCFPHFRASSESKEGIYEIRGLICNYVEKFGDLENSYKPEVSLDGLLKSDVKGLALVVSTDDCFTKLVLADAMDESGLNSLACAMRSIVSEGVYSSRFQGGRRWWGETIGFLHPEIGVRVCFCMDKVKNPFYCVNKRSILDSIDSMVSGVVEKLLDKVRLNWITVPVGDGGPSCIKCPEKAKAAIEAVILMDQSKIEDKTVRFVVTALSK